MVLGLKSEEESKVVNNELVVEQEIKEESDVKPDESINVTEELNIIVEPVPPAPSTFVEDNAATRAAKRAQRLASFQAESIARDREYYEYEKKLKLKLLSEDQHNRFIKEQEEAARLARIEREKTIFRQRRSDTHEATRLLKIQQEANGIAYQQKLDFEKEVREETARIQREAERNAAEAIRLAEEAQRAADIVNAEAERFADEARRRLRFAEAKAKEAGKKIQKTIDTTDKDI